MEIKIKSARENAGISQEELAKAVGIGKRTLIDYEKGASEPKISTLKKIAEICNTTINELIGNTQGKHDSCEDTYEIIRLDLHASAGHGIQNFHTQETLVTLDRSLFPRPVSPQNLRIVPVVGDSMEPTIPDASHIVIDISQTDRIDGIYVIRLDDNIMVKRLQFNLDGTVEIISDNPRYATQHYDPTQTQVNFEIIGRKILTIQ